MQMGLSIIPETHKISDVIDTMISFGPFVKYLENRAKGEKTSKSKVYEQVLQEFYKEPDSSSHVEVENIHRYAGLLDLIYMVLSPFTADENDYLWALSAPLSRHVFYGTDAYVKLIESENSAELESKFIHEEKERVRKRFKKFIYKMVLDKYYGNSYVNIERIIYSHLDAATGLTKYFLLKPDTRFIEIHHKNKLPSLDLTNPGLYIKDGQLTDLLEEALPLSNFYIEGFTVVTLEDITGDYTIEVIKKDLIGHSGHEDALFERVRHGLKILGGCKDIEFGMLPFLSVNNRLVLDDVECSRSIIINAARKIEPDMATMYASAQRYADNPEVQVFPSIGENEKLNAPHIYALTEIGVKAYAIIPVYYNQTAVGILEVYSRADVEQIHQILSRLEEAMPLVAQLLQNSIEQFNLRINDIIRDKFTPIQSSVQWKFNEVALSYFRARHAGNDDPPLGVVAFHNVYPLYGMIDIRNSTIERNRALAEDIANLLNLLQTEEANICSVLSKENAPEVTKKFDDWYGHIGNYLKMSDSGLLGLLLESDVAPYLGELLTTYPETEISARRLKTIIEQSGDEICGSRNRLEQSIQLINSALNDLFRRDRKMLKAIYPCYFETFRTDGVEYDLYTGRSIKPEIEFTRQHLEALRLWQLKSMCEIVRITNRLTTDMPTPLHTTQLIYVNPHPIDISFRNDERHFDVDGAYNIRYQIVKKRIDKVHVNDTGERLTQPGKIAIVYFNEDDLEEYIKYIRQCQEEDILYADFEMLELEDLQGVSGLKAMRVEVKL